MTREDATIAMCYLTTSLLCNTPNTTQFVATPYDPPGSPGFVDCYSYMYSLPLGGLPSGYWQTEQCKYIHTVLAADLPEIHCPHIGKSGGGQCRNRFVPGAGLDHNGNPDPSQAFDPYGIPYGPGYIEDHSRFFLNRAYDPRDADMEKCLDERANLSD